MILLFMTLSFVAQTQHVPTFEEVISLRNVGTVAMSPDGNHVAFTIQTTDWVDNSFDSEIWLSKNNQKPFKLTNTIKGSSTRQSFSPDGKWITFLADRGNKSQIHVISLNGGEARAITKEEENISSYEWHPSGTKLFILKNEKEAKDKKDLEKRYGSFESDDKEYTRSHIWQIDFNPDQLDPSEYPCYETVDSLKVKAGCIELPKAVRLTAGEYTITNFMVSPQGDKIAFNHQPNPLINTGYKADVSILNLADKNIMPLINHPSGDYLQSWSPDSKEILFTTFLSDTTSFFYKNQKLYAIEIATKKTRQLASELDESLNGFLWTPTGIYAALWNKTKRPIYKVDPISGKHSVLSNMPEQIYGIASSQNGKLMAIAGRNGDQLTEVFVASTSTPSATQITDITAQIKDWKVAQSEVISWKSKDGATIEGILHKPKDYDPSKKYPLLVVIHGGPTGIDVPAPLPGSVYPIAQWLDKGCLVLRPNYRGSAGYGEKFRSLNVNNLGVGDAWDVLSGVDYLDSKGMINKNKMGCMGWSQGGYISAFLTTNTDVFKAISVGAGISNWMTYYVNTDIHPFTRQYLQSTPWNNEALYKKTSPMTTINNAKTPTLIQHGEFDKRVPIANAYELLQGLRDVGVPSELIIYKGFGHGITKPKERLAANWHNWQWFNKYIWNEEVVLPLSAK